MKLQTFRKYIIADNPLVTEILTFGFMPVHSERFRWFLI
jgi:hypothetical protein